jgi:hypothetical protein
MGHIILILIVVLIIVGVQCYLFVKTFKDIQDFGNIFPQSTDELYAYDSVIFKGKDAKTISESVANIAKIEKDIQEQRDLLISDDSYLNDAEEELDKAKSYLSNKINSVKNKGYADDSTFSKIINSINNYLLKNKGGTSDYHLMKDIVERNCDAKENEIDTQIPTPLYMGLMGTILGIFLGVIFLISTGGLKQLLSNDYDMVTYQTKPKQIIGRYSLYDVVDNRDTIVFKNQEIDDYKAVRLVRYAQNQHADIKLKADNSGSEGVSSLLTGIALAMIASFIGILLTTIGSILFKKSKRKLEDSKTDFLSWIQAELLPQLASDVSGTLVKMGQNLNDFNNTFSKNTKELRTTLDKVNESYRGQAEVLNSIQRLRINEIATANIAVYDKLKNSTQELGELTKYLSECSSVMSKLGKYLNNSESYLIQVKELNDKLDAAEERTKTLERMGKFFEAELGEIEQRKANMTAAVGIVDNALQEALIEMQDNVKKQFSELEKSSAEQQLALENKLKETTVLIDELKNLTAVKSSMERMEKLTDEQNKRMLRIIESIENISNYGYSEPSNNYKPRLLPKWAKVLLITGGSLLSAACLLFILSVFNIL